MTQHARRNKARATLNAKEIALLELLRAPDTYVESGWRVLVDRVREALSVGDVREAPLRAAVASEHSLVVRESFAELVEDLSAA